MKIRKNVVKNNKKQNSNYRTIKINKRFRPNNKIQLDSLKYSSREKLLPKNIKFRVKRNKPKNYEKTFRLIFNAIILLLFLASYYFCCLSLEKCFQGEDACSRKLNWIQLKLTQYIISVVSISHFQIMKHLNNSFIFVNLYLYLKIRFNIKKIK